MWASDALRSTGRLIAAQAAVARDERAARRAGLPTHADGVTPAWLARALVPVHPGVVVEDCEILDDHAGTTARARLRVGYRAPGHGPLPPDTVFLKITPRARLQRLFLAAIGIGRNEVRFYRTAAAGWPVRIPRLHGLAAMPGERQFVLVLEDLVAAGARFSAVGDRLEPDEAARILASMASLHAALWESPRFRGDLAWLPDYERRAVDMPWERFITGAMVGRTRRRHAGTFGRPFVEAADTVIRHRDRLERLWSEGPRTFVHGDAHLGNLYFVDGAVGFLDWQVCARAPGMRDVSYLLCTSLPSELREQHERALIREYLAALKAAGAEAPSFEDAWRQHRLFALYGFIAAAFTAAAGEGLQAGPIAEAGLRRATRAVEALESVACALASDR